MLLVQKPSTIFFFLTLNDHFLKFTFYILSFLSEVNETKYIFLEGSKKRERKRIQLSANVDSNPQPRAREEGKKKQKRI